MMLIESLIIKRPYWQADTFRLMPSFGSIMLYRFHRYWIVLVVEISNALHFIRELRLKFIKIVTIYPRTAFHTASHSYNVGEVMSNLLY